VSAACGLQQNLCGSAHVILDLGYGSHALMKTLCVLHEDTS